MKLSCKSTRFAVCLLVAFVLVSGHSASAVELTNTARLYEEHYDKIKKPSDPSNTFADKAGSLKSQFLKDLTARQKANNKFLLDTANKHAEQSERQFLWSVAMEKDLPTQKDVDHAAVSRHLTSESAKVVTSMAKAPLSFLKTYESGLNFDFDFGRMFKSSENEPAPKATVADHRQRYVRYGLVLVDIQPRKNDDEAQYAALGDLDYYQWQSANIAKPQWEIRALSGPEQSGLNKIDADIFKDQSKQDMSLYDKFVDALPEANFKTHIKPSTSIENDLKDAENNGGSKDLGLTLNVTQSQGYYTLKQNFNKEFQNPTHVIKIPTSTLGTFSKTYNVSWEPIYMSWTNILNFSNFASLNLHYDNLNKTYKYDIGKNISGHNLSLTAEILPGLEMHTYHHELNKGKYRLNYSFAF